jgi:hypothetical protein
MKTVLLPSLSLYCITHFMKLSIEVSRSRDVSTETGSSTSTTIARVLVAYRLRT